MSATEITWSYLDMLPADVRNHVIGPCIARCELCPKVSTEGPDIAPWIRSGKCLGCRQAKNLRNPKVRSLMGLAPLN